MSKSNQVLPTVWAVMWISGWGNIPNSLEAGFFRREDADADPRIGRDTYDGVSAATEGYFAVRELSPPKALITIAGQGYEFEECANELDVGAWKGEKPHPKRCTVHHTFGPDWNWNNEESHYLQALIMARKVQAAEEAAKASKGSRRVTLHLIPAAFDRLTVEAGEGGSLSEAANRRLLK
jgi:hypothetical protein